MTTQGKMECEQNAKHVLSIIMTAVRSKETPTKNKKEEQITDLI